MVSTIDCSITSPKSQNLADNRKPLLAGVATVTPAIFIQGVTRAPKAPVVKPGPW